MKGNLHCVESHEAESALFFGEAFLEGRFWRAQKVDELRIGGPKKKKSSCQAFGGRMEKEKL